MLKQIIAAAALVAATGSVAQTRSAANGAALAAACPAGTHYATVRHSQIKGGKWAIFEQAVADHSAWYKAHGDATTTRIVRLLTPAGKPVGLSQDDAMTITVYSGKAQPAHDAGYEAFTAKYRDSSTIKDEMRGCLPAL